MKEKGKMKGSEVKRIREELGMGFTAFANEIGCTYSSIRNMEIAPDIPINKTMELAIRYAYQINKK